MKYQLLPFPLLSPLSSIHLEYTKMALKLWCGVVCSRVSRRASSLLQCVWGRIPKFLLVARPQKHWGCLRCTQLYWCRCRAGCRRNRFELYFDFWLKVLFWDTLIYYGTHSDNMPGFSSQSHSSPPPSPSTYHFGMQSSVWSKKRAREIPDQYSVTRQFIK